DPETELGREDHSIAFSLERPAEERFIRERSVDFGGVEERDAEVDGAVNRRNRFPLITVFRRAVRLAHPHAAQAERRNDETVCPECARLHAVSSTPSISRPH